MAERLRFRSARELRKILDQVMKEIESDPDDAPRVGAAAAPLRLEFTDLGLVMNISRSDRGELRWDFRKRSALEPKLSLEMESEFGNRFFQGGENAAIAIARGRIRTHVSDAGAALRFFPASRPIFSRYRRVVLEKYPHLALDPD